VPRGRHVIISASVWLKDDTELRDGSSVLAAIVPTRRA
jgi:hypothetical protein